MIVLLHSHENIKIYEINHMTAYNRKEHNNFVHFEVVTVFLRISCYRFGMFGNLIVLSDGLKTPVQN